MGCASWRRRDDDQRRRFPAVRDRAGIGGAGAGRHTSHQDGRRPVDGDRGNGSDLGTWLHQEAGGPALGVFEEDPDQLADLEQLLTPPQKTALATVATPQALADQLGANLIAAAAVCRLHYWHATTEPLPGDTVTGLWGYYKQFYNSQLGAATMPEFIDALKLTDLGALPLG